MAAPHVAGIAAIILEQNPGWSSSQVANEITITATTNVLSNIGSGSPNRLAYTPRAQEPLVGSIDGPSEVADTKTHTWYSEHSGGDGVYSFQWDRRFIYPDGSSDPWQTAISTADSVSIFVDEGGPSFDLRLWIWSGGQQVVDTLEVTVTCAGPCIESDDPTEPEAY